MVVSDVMGENGKHHGMLLDDRKNRKVRIMSCMKEEWRKPVLMENVMKKKGGCREQQGEEKKSISPSLFIKRSSATQRWNNQKAHFCSVRGNDREGEGNSHLDRTVESKSSLTTWHAYLCANTDRPFWPSHMKGKSFNKVGKKVKEGEEQVKESYRENSQRSANDSESQSRESLLEAHHVWGSEAQAGVHTLTPCHHTEDDGATHVLISAVGELEAQRVQVAWPQGPGAIAGAAVTQSPGLVKQPIKQRQALVESAAPDLLWWVTE